MLQSWQKSNSTIYPTVKKMELLLGSSLLFGATFAMFPLLFPFFAALFEHAVHLTHEKVVTKFLGGFYAKRRFKRYFG
jgi:hypothetical protein